MQHAETGDMTINEALRLSMHQLNAAYEAACSEYGASDVRAHMLADAVLFMRGWLRRYSVATQPAEVPGATPP